MSPACALPGVALLPGCPVSQAFPHSPNPLNAPAAPQPRVATARHPAPPPDAFERRIRLGGPPVGVAIASGALPSPYNPPVVEIGRNGTRGGTQKSVEVRWTRY